MTDSKEMAIAYKKDVSKRYISLDPSQIDARLAGTAFFASRKYDGELALLFWDGKECASVNSGGKEQKGFPCLGEAAALFKKAKIKNAVFASELYRKEDSGRTRVFDARAAIADPALHAELRLALFDIASINGEDYKGKPYSEVLEKLRSVCGGSETVHPVLCETLDSKEAVKELFEKWVTKEGSEGIVIRSELPMVYKLKPRHSLDAVIAGFAEGTGEIKNQVRTLLLALMTEDGFYKIIGKCPGSSLDVKTRKDLYGELLAMKAESDYTEIDSNHTAFHAVKPEKVVEITVSDLLYESSGGVIFNPVLSFNGGYSRERMVPGVSLINPSFSRFREDKKPNAQDIRESQLGEINASSCADAGVESAALAKSKLLKREVYKKTQGGKLMVQKFMAWKTNKAGDYPAYVLAYSNYSSDRAEALQQEVRISDSEAQIMEMYDNFVEKNVKKGWEKHG